MELVIENKNFQANVGDIIEYERTGGVSHYLVCKSDKDGYFIVNISGEKSGIHYYDNLSDLIRNQRGITKIYSMEEYQLVLRRKKVEV